MDKGSFDAICSEDTPEALAKSYKYLNEVFRVLDSKGGAFVCISLLQPFVFKALLDFVNKGNENKLFGDNIFDFRVQRIDKYLRKSPKVSEFVPFFIQIRKTKIDTGAAPMVALQKSFRDHVNLI